MRKIPSKLDMRKLELRKLTRYALLSCMLQFGVSYWEVITPCVIAQEGAYTTLAPKITENAEKTAAVREKTAEVKAASGSSVAAIVKFYRDYAIPTITQLQTSPNEPPAVTRLNEVNQIRRSFEEDLENLSRAPKSFRAVYNKALLTELEKVIKEPKCHPSARVICFGMAMQLYSEPANQAPALPSRSLLPLIASALRPEERLDANQLLALDAVERFLLTKSTQADEILTEDFKVQLCTRINALLRLDTPTHRVQKSHQYILERALRTLTTMAVVGQANAATANAGSTKQAATAVAKFIKVALPDARSSEWLKEACCISLGAIKYPDGTFTPDEALLIEQEVAKYSIKSLKDWLNKVAKSGGSASGMGGYGSSYGSGLADSGMMPSSDMSSSGAGYGMPGFGNATANQSNVSRQPAEVKNARRMLNQRMERIHMALYGTLIGDGKTVSETPAQKGIASFAPASEKFKLDHAIEKLRAVQLAVNDDKIADLSTLSSFTNEAIREFGAACFEISGDREKAMEDEQDLQMSFFGLATPQTPEGANAPDGQGPGAPANQPPNQPGANNQAPAGAGAAPRQPAANAPRQPAAAGAGQPAANNAPANQQPVGQPRR